MQQQLQDLKLDIERLSAERDNIGRYGIGEAWSDNNLSRNNHDDEAITARLAEQEASFEQVARRARERLMEQESIISSLKDELSRAQDSLHSIQASRHDDVFSSGHHGSHSLNPDNRSGIGVSTSELG